MRPAKFLRYLLPQALVGAAVGIGFREALDPVSARDAGFYLQSGLHGAIVGTGIGLTTLGFRAFIAPRLRRAPLLLEILAWSLAILAGTGLFFFGATYAVYGAPSMQGMVPILPVVLGVTFAVALVLAFVARIARLLGMRLLRDLLTGSYQRPQIERRIVLFLDLAGSTTLAERFGEARIQKLIARFFADIDDAFADAGAEVLGYVGDGVILCWRAQDRRRNGRAAEGLLAARKAIAALSASYQAEFGLTPDFRAGVHLGDVSVGEIGGRRRQISLFGDTMNVAARLQGEAKAVASGWIASAAYVAHADLPAGLRARDLGALELRGRVEPVPAYALEAV